MSLTSASSEARIHCVMALLVVDKKKAHGNKPPHTNNTTQQTKNDDLSTRGGLPCGVGRRDATTHGKIRAPMPARRD
jgi:hypothetical protein